MNNNVVYIVSEVDCGEPPHRDYSTTTGNHLYSDTVVYRCDEGYRTDAGIKEDRIKCTLTGQWDKVPSECSRKCTHCDCWS